MATRRVKTPVAASDAGLPALPLNGAVTVLAPTSSASAEHIIGAETSAVQILAEADVYVAVDSDATASSWLLVGKSYSTYGVTPGQILSFRAVTGTASVRILEA